MKNQASGYLLSKTTAFAGDFHPNCMAFNRGAVINREAMTAASRGVTERSEGTRGYCRLDFGPRKLAFEFAVVPAVSPVAVVHDVLE